MIPPAKKRLRNGEGDSYDKMSVCGTWRIRRCHAALSDRTGAGGSVQRIPGQNTFDQYTRCVCHRRAGGSGRKTFTPSASGTDVKDRRLRRLYNIFHLCARDQPAVPERKLWTGDRVCVRQCYFEHCGGAVRVHVAVLSRADAMQRKGRA